MNSVGDKEAGGRRFCVSGGTKSLSTSTRCMVWRPAGKELQQASGRVREGGVLSQCPTSHLLSLLLCHRQAVMLGACWVWSQLEKTVRSVVWWFRVP